MYKENALYGCVCTNILQILSTTVYVNTSSNKKSQDQILDVTNNTLYILLLNQFIPDIIASR